MIDKLKMHSPDITDDNIIKIRELFPNCVTETKDKSGKITLAVDFDLLQQELSHSLIEGNKERYQLSWPGKRQALLTANAPTTKTLRPARDESVNFDSTENLFIEGDNLEVLKLLQESYLGKVKMIYIDPPYNTGKDFIYSDNFSENTEEYMLRSGQKDEEGNRLTSNTESNGRYHSDWLSMMYPRLKLARNLLTDDGVIFISIDENEVNNLRKICDEIFGEENYIECISWNKRIPKNDKGIGNIHEYILVYIKDMTLKNEFTMRKEGLSEIYELVEKLKNKGVSIVDSELEIKKLYKKNGYDRGITLYNSFDNHYRLWGKINMSWPNSNTFGPTYQVLHPITKKNVKQPDRGWRWKQETFNEEAGLEEGEYTNIKRLHDGSVMCKNIWFAEDENTQPSSITYLDDVNRFLLRSILSLKSDGGIETENIFGQKSYFAYPKPTKLLRLLIDSIDSKNSLILDFFAGSSTTAHAVMQLNAEDGGNRKFIMVQIPEETDTKSEAYKAGYKNIADISKERIRRAGKKVVSDKWEVISKEEKLKYACKELSRSDCMAEVNGASQASLFSDQKTSDQSNLETLDTKSETEATASSLQTSGVPCRYGYLGSDAALSGDREDGKCSFKGTTNCPLITKDSLDIGFRVLKLDTSNFGDVYYLPDKVTQQSLEMHADNIKIDRNSEDLLYQVLLDWGVDLSLPIRREIIAGLEVFFVADNTLAACFETDKKITEELCRELTKRDLLRVVFRDSGFTDDSLKINVEQMFRQLSPSTEVKVI